MVETTAAKAVEAGLGPTRQRYLIIDALEQLEHATAQAVFECVQRQEPEVPTCLATVYNTLNRLCDERIIGRIIGLKGPTVFDKDPDSHQHWLYPDGRIEDIPPAQQVLFVDTPQIPRNTVQEAVHVLIRLESTSIPE